MANSAQWGTTNKYVVYWVEHIQNWQDIGQNYSNVTVKVWAKRTNSGYQTYGTGSVNVTINGSNYSSSITSSMKITSSPIVLGSWTMNIGHNADGGKTYSVGASFNISGVVSSGTNWVDFGLTTIPRTSNATMESNYLHMIAPVRIHMNRSSTAFTHKIFEDFGLGWWNEIASGVTDNWDWNRGWDYANRIPNSTSGAGKLLVQTWNGGTLIGSVELYFTLFIQDWECLPYWSGEPYFEVIQENSIPAGELVQTQNRVRVKCSPSGAYGSTISSVSANYWSQKTEWGWDTTSPYPSVSGHHGIPVIATDSRGRQIKKDLSVYIHPWFTPWTAIDSLWRCDSDGTENTNGAYIKGHIRASAPTIGSNWTKHRLLLYWRSNPNDAWSLYHEVFTSATYDIYPMFQASTEKSYDIKAVLDAGGKLYESIKSIGTAFTTVDFRAGGKGVSFGSVATADTFNVSLPMTYKNRPFPTVSTTYIPAGTDFNNIRDVGDYFNAGNVECINFKNAAFDSYAFRLEVRNWAGGDVSPGDNRNLLQIWHTFDGKAVAIRSYQSWSSSWDKWCYYSCDNGKSQDIIFEAHMGEKSIRRENHATYAFWGESDVNGPGNPGNAGYWNTTHGLVWSMNGSSGQLTIRAGYNTSSDRRLKHDIEELDKDKVNKLFKCINPVSYKYNDDYLNKETYFGFIAQDIESNMKASGYNESVAMVSKFKSNKQATCDTYHLSYPEFIAIAYKKIQILDEELELKDLKIKALEDAITSIKGRLDKIEGKI